MVHKLHLTRCFVGLINAVLFFSVSKLYKAFFSGLVDEIYFVTQNEIQIAVY